MNQNLVSFCKGYRQGQQAYYEGRVQVTGAKGVPPELAHWQRCAPPGFKREIVLDVQRMEYVMRETREPQRNPLVEHDNWRPIRDIV